jgi:hypothetical protein
MLESARAGRRRWLRITLGIALVIGMLLAAAAVVLLRPPGAVIAASQSAGPATAAPDPAPASLLHQVLAAHGGAERWRGLRALRVKARFGGLAFRTRFIEPGPAARWLEIDLREPRVAFEDYPQPGQRGVFTRDRVWIESADGAMVAALDRPREVLMASRRRQLWWDDLDLLYFAGYAAWNYLQGPFLFLHAGVETREIEPWMEKGETWRRLAVRFHETVPTHSREQVFYFDGEFRQRRHDYRPDVFASWAHAAQYTSDHHRFQGFWFPTRRAVYPRGNDNHAASSPLLVWVEVLDVRVLPLQ